MIKVYKKLTEDQVKRNVIFSSTLSEERTEQDGDTIHEIYNSDVDANKVIERLLNDSFFNNSPWSFNIIRKGIK